MTKNTSYIFATGFELEECMQEMYQPILAEKAKRFFKTTENGYSANDQFLGIAVPTIRKMIKACAPFPSNEIVHLLYSHWHEIRLASLLILVKQYEAKQTPAEEKKLYIELYLKHTSQINNWDLVDTSAGHILGHYLSQNEPDKACNLLQRLAQSPLLWERRIALVACHPFIKKNNTGIFFDICIFMLNDQEDLIHKAMGWMLREVGKHSGHEVLKQFLLQHIQDLPRTTVRYAIEHFSTCDKQIYVPTK